MVRNTRAAERDYATAIMGIHHLTAISSAMTRRPMRRWPEARWGGIDEKGGTSDY